MVNGNRWKMKDDIYDELDGVAWIAKRDKKYRAAVDSLIENCKCVSGDFFTDFSTPKRKEHTGAAELLDYVFCNPNSNGSIAWDCEFGLIEMIFSTDEALLVLWSDVSISLTDAIERMSGIFEHLSADAGYVALTGSIPINSDDFRRDFLGDLFYRFGSIE
jgi:hypothetical protein